MTSIQPELWVDRGAEAVAFYQAAFGATVLHRAGGGQDIVAQLAIGDAAFWVSTAGSTGQRIHPKAVGGATSRTLLIVDDPEAVFHHAVTAGATPTSPPADEHGWLAVNWTSQPAPATFRELDQILAAALPAGSCFRLPGRLYDLFGRRYIDLTDPGQASAPLVPGSDPGNPQLPGQARIYTLQQQPRYGPGSPGRRGLAPVPGPALSNADMFGPRPASHPSCPAGTSCTTSHRPTCSAPRS